MRTHPRIFRAAASLFRLLIRVAASSLSASKHSTQNCSILRKQDSNLGSFQSRSMIRDWRNLNAAVVATSSLILVELFHIFTFTVMTITIKLQKSIIRIKRYCRRLGLLPAIFRTLGC